MKALYLDCISGISGDMTVGALVDLGVRPSALEWELSKLPIGEFHMHFDRAKRKEIEGIRFTIHEGTVHRPEQDEHKDAHSHSHHHEEEEDHEHHHHHEHGEEGHHHHHEDEHGDCGNHNHGNEVEHSHSHEHDHDHGECSGHDHDHEHHHEHEHARAYADIRSMLEASELSPFVKKHALGIFRRIAVAEGKIHGKSPDEVHFHEVGALDSIADIVMACVGIESLGATRIFASPLHDGHGTVECAHGTFPVPAPATLEILQGIPLGQIDEPHELITPTGAAIIAEFAESFGQMPTLKIEKIGYGLGKRDLATRPNVLRAVLGELTA
jgi:pyridinium-3,5-bisthiocarboxylic acid mononucleotide nickel chelatase